MQTHTVLIIDNSGSMKIKDVVSSDGTLISRHGAVFEALQKGFFDKQQQAVQGSAAAADSSAANLVTMIRLGEDAEIIFDLLPLDKAGEMCAKVGEKQQHHVDISTRPMNDANNPSPSFVSAVGTLIQQPDPPGVKKIVRLLQKQVSLFEFKVLSSVSISTFFSPPFYCTFLTPLFINGPVPCAQATKHPEWGVVNTQSVRAVKALLAVDPDPDSASDADCDSDESGQAGRMQPRSYACPSTTSFL